MKRHFYYGILVLFAFLPHPAGAQEFDEFSELDRMDMLNAQKTAFFTNRLQLTSEESARFWPVYNEYQKELNGIRQEKRSVMVYFSQNYSLINEKEALVLAEKFNRLQLKEPELAGVYHNKFLEVLPAKKVLRLYQTETLYKTFLLRQLRDRAQNARQRRFVP